ncbi:MAG: acyl-phosphate glycerol-3-phosphate acyltransferase [Candidatus Angelobacter sp.]|jgi:glycerol-3-phosphate acyltransferase PlsY|nr:acyl-phosphate glycerol-3-phosphate acyltransferase [Candidatus Angelobacter sp.]
MTKTYFIIATVSYLLGSIPFGYILVRLFMKQDIRATGSGNIGATNVARSGAKGLAIATLVLDAGKGYLAVVTGQQIYEHSLLRNANAPGTYWLSIPIEELMLTAGIAALFAIIGHCFPVWLKFKGGKGVATAVGAFAALAPKAVLVSLLVFALVLIFSRYVSLASIAASAVFPVAAYWLHSDLRPAKLMALLIAGPALIIAKHHENIRRLIAHTESSIGAKSA